jgi:hypothetical protein
MGSSLKLPLNVKRTDIWHTRWVYLWCWVPDKRTKPASCLVRISFKLAYARFQAKPSSIRAKFVFAT